MKSFLGAFLGAVAGIFAGAIALGVVDLKRSPVAPEGVTDGIEGSGDKSE